MNKAVLEFLKSEHQLNETRVFIRDLFVQVSPLFMPLVQITVSGVSNFFPQFKAMQIR